jgi:glycogen(starch) synthase
MNILYISSEYPVETGYGGIGTYTKYAAEGMVRRGHTVHVLCRSVSAEVKTTNENGVTVHRIPSLGYRIPQGKRFYLLRKACYKLLPHTLIRQAWAKTVSAAVIDIERTAHFDIIEFPECGAEGFYLKGSLKPKRIARLHTPWETVRKLDKLQEAPLDTFFLSFMEKFSVKKATAVSSPSHALADQIKCHWNLKKITVFPNPIPLHNFSITKGTEWIYTGRVERRKGVHILIQAYNEISRRISVPPLYIIGSPYGFMADGMSYEDYIRDLMDKNGSGNTIKWVKGTTLDKVKDYLTNSSVAFLPSLWENFPYSCLEALACGLVVVASDCGGFPEIIKNEAMYKLVKNPEKINYMSTKARESARKFDSDIICKYIEKFYSQCGSS